MRVPGAYLAGLLLTVAGFEGQSPGVAGVKAAGEVGDTSHFTFRVDATEPNVTKTPEGFKIEMESPGVSLRHPGAPDIPVQLVRVAIPADCTPRLAIALTGDALTPGIRPRPQPTADSDVWGDLGAEPPSAGDADLERFFRDRFQRRDHRQEDERVYDGASIYPERVAWLGEIGTFRDQRYVEVYVAPVRWDPSIAGLRVARGLTLTVLFEGGSRIRKAVTVESPFEDAYRKAFVNYEQGTLFRNGTAPALDASSAPAVSPQAPAAGPLYRIRVRANGVVRLTVARMNGTGFSSQPLSTWKLTNRGLETPLLVHDTNGNDLLDGTDWVQFYGQALDDEPKTVLNTDFPNTTEDIYEARDFSDENVYFLSTESGSRSRLPVRPSAPTNTRTPPADFESIAHQEIDSGWRPLGGADPWYWLPTLVSNASPTSRTDGVPLPGLASGTAPARIIVKVRGITEAADVAPDHRTRVTLKNATSQTLATNDDNGTFDGRSIYVHDFTWTYGGTGPVLTEPAQVVLDALPTAGVTTNQVILDWIEIRYRRSFVASGDALTIDYPDGDTEFQISGIASSAPEVWEITGRLGSSPTVSPVRITVYSITGTGPYTIRFRVDNDPALADGTPRRFVVAGDAAVSVPADPDFTADVVSDLRNTTNQADMIVISTPSVLGATGSAARTTLTNLLNYHASKGITSKIAMLEDVQDEFNAGLAGPLAIKNFLAWVMSTQPGEGWSAPKPRYVLLIGDGSYDYKGGEPSGNYVPTQILFKDDPQLGYYASDNLMAAVVGTDQLADLVVGRVPARDPATADAVLQKILNYQQNPPTGNWRRHALVVSDRGKVDAQGQVNVGEALDFEGTNDEGLAFMKAPPHTLRKIRYYTDYYAAVPQKSPLQCRTDIKSAVNGTDGVSDGASIVQYTGHGNFSLWSDDSIFVDSDVDALVNGGKTPFLLAHGCLTGGFHTTAARAFGEDWLNRIGGGAIAVLAPSGLSFNYVGRTATDAVWNDIFGPDKLRTLGGPVLDNLSTLCGQGSIEPCQQYVLLGDPATDLVMPAVDKPRNVVATAGNARIDLSWTASTTTGATYDIYRSFDIVGGSYSKINVSPVSGTSYADTTAVNTVTYYYYLVALDPQGFESRWSNFNSDCGVGGPDCVTATPTNPNPPNPPTGLAAADPETGGKLNLTWNANAETDIKYYEVFWGVAAGVYTNSFNSGKATNTTLTGLTNGVTYYIAVKATNTSLRTSAYSAEQTGVPTFVRGVKSPRFITDLRVDKSAANAFLSWGAVTTDIYGKSETVARYEVYRGTTPTFVPGPGNKIASPTTTSFTDIGALGGATPNYYYLVAAVDVDGNTGGLGRQLPNGIDTMTLAKSTITPGNLVLTWPAVTIDFDGAPTSIDHYEVYVRGTPFSRGDIRDGTVPLMASTSATTLTVTPPAGSQYYSVITVDVKGNKSPF